MTIPIRTYEDLTTQRLREDAVVELASAELFYRKAGPNALDARRARDRALQNYHEAHRNRVLFIASMDIIDE